MEAGVAADRLTPSPPPCFLQRVRNGLKRKELSFGCLRKSAKESATSRKQRSCRAQLEQGISLVMAGDYGLLEEEAREGATKERAKRNAWKIVARKYRTSKCKFYLFAGFLWKTRDMTLGAARGAASNGQREARCRDSHPRGR